MKNYKEYEKNLIGCSDIATLVMVGYDSKKGVKTELLHFGSDGSYSAYSVDENTEIPPYYEQVAEFNGWLKIYDDEELTAVAFGDKIKIYRSGNFGCIIQCIKEDK